VVVCFPRFDNGCKKGEKPLVNNKKLSYAEIVGVHLRRRRKEFGMTQAEFGEKIGLTEKGVGRLERGERAPSCITLQKIHIKGEISIDRLLQDVNVDKPVEDN
jgi:transcriptional regulator with XRE-family HTH domain